MRLGLKSPLAKRVGGVLALLGAGAAVVLSFPFSGWFLAGRPGALDYGLFGVLTLLAAALGTLPGLLVGMVIDRLSRRPD
jgi:hypothetical protein